MTSDPAGFDHWDILLGQGKYYRPDFVTVDGKSDIEGYVTDVITDKSLTWLKHGRDPEKPFLLMVHHKAPHRPWDPAAIKLAKYENRQFKEPATLFDDFATRGRVTKEAEMRISQMNPGTDLKLWETNGDRNWLYGHMTSQERTEWEKHVDPRLAKFNESMPKGRERTKWFYQLYMRD